MKSLWEELRPCVEALLEANRALGVVARLPEARGIEEQEFDVGQLLIRLGNRPRAEKLQVLPLEGRYWDKDGHAVFLSAFRNEAGEIAEIELSRVDLQPIGRLPERSELTFSKPQAGYYDAKQP